MRANLRARGVKLSPDLENYIQEKIVQKAGDLLDDPAAFLDVDVTDEFGPKGGRDKKVTLTLNLPDKKVVHLEETTDDFFGSVNLLEERLENTLKKYKEKTRDISRFPKKYKTEELIEEEENKGY